jgi:ABC-type sugar transport system permease subunit
MMFLNGWTGRFRPVHPLSSLWPIVGRLARVLLTALPLAFLIIFLFYPLLNILGVSLAPEGRLDLSALGELIGNRFHRRTIWFTAWQAALSTALTLALALPGAYVFARYEFRGKALLRALTTIPFVLPTVVVAAAFGALLGPRGRGATSRRRLLGQLEPPPGRGCGRAGGWALASVPRSDAAHPYAGDSSLGVAGLYLLLYQLWRGAAPGRATLCHDRGRDLQSDLHLP